MKKSQTGWRSAIPKLTCIAALGVLAAFASQATADVVTDPVGFISLTAVGNGLSMVSLGLTRLPVDRGLIANTPSGTQLPVNSSLTVDQFAPSSGTNYVIEITSGANAGLMDDIVSNTTASIFTATDDSSLVSSGNLYKVYPAWTLNTAFGPPSQSGLFGSNILANADNVIVWNPLTQSSDIYWYRSTGGSPGWRSTDTFTDVGNTALPFGAVMQIQRKIATQMNYVMPAPY